MNQEEKLLSAIFSVGRLIREEICKDNCLVDFTQAEVEILKFLQGKKNTPMKLISDYLHIKPSSTTPVIENLVKKGSIERFQYEEDRRLIYVEITPKGTKVLEKKYKNIHKTVGKIFKKLSEKDKNDLTKIFEKIQK